MDDAFTAGRCRDWRQRHGMRHLVTERMPGQRGSVVVERRWMVERSFGALAQWGGLLRSRVGCLDMALERLARVIALSGLEDPANSKASLKIAASAHSNSL